jgi:hypothetical protein
MVLSISVEACRQYLSLLRHNLLPSTAQLDMTAPIVRLTEPSLPIISSCRPPFQCVFFLRFSPDTHRLHYSQDYTSVNTHAYITSNPENHSNSQSLLLSTDSIIIMAYQYQAYPMGNMAPYATSGLAPGTGEYCSVMLSTQS